MLGVLRQSFTYHTDGNIHTASDGKNQVTTYTNYKRGIPQNVRFHNSQTTSVVVNNIGKITSLTNEAATTTTFGYDSMGRIQSVNYPRPDTVSWAPTTVSTWQAPTGQFDLTANHWRQLVSTGNSRTATYYDALWRPVYVERWDESDVANTLRTVKYMYDSAGNLLYESYPRRTYGQIGPGVYYAFDALGRQTAQAAKSEVGESNGYAWTRTKYEPDFKTEVTDPRGNVTTFGYQTFDEPSYATITSISMPESVTVTIARDYFSKPIAITRGDTAKSVTRRYVYNSAQLVCKTLEPETTPNGQPGPGATIQDYDVADNITWRATGLAFPSPTNCDTASVAVGSKVNYQYDGRNRATGSTFGDNSPAVVITLTPDGLPLTLNSGGAVWTNTYNKRRLIEKESLAFGAATYPVSRSYDTNASLLQMTYPDNTSVVYSPNALGEPSKVGNYATAISYHPNGAVAGFIYGPGPGGVTHSLTQNERGLPERWVDGSAINDWYRYDASGNVASITDMLAGNVSNRSMTYDGLDRLKTVTAPGMWGTAAYGYDAVDNLTSVSLSQGGTARSTLHSYDAVTNRLDSITNGPPGFNVSYLYDNRGNVTKRNAQVFEFDLGNRLKAAPGRATYSYDARYRRVSIVGTDGVTRVQVYSGDGKLLYIAPTGGTATKYIHLGNRVVAEVSGSTVTYDHTDALGSPVAQSNAAGAITTRTRYEPYGYLVAGSPRTIGFAGHVNDNDTGLVYMQHRYYDTFAGRFLSIDPVTTDANTGSSFNRYAYAANSPYKYVDPDGRQERAAEAFSDQFRNDAASGNSGVYEPFHTPVVIATLGMAVGPPIAAAIIAGAPAEAAVAVAAAGKATTIVAKNGVEIKSIARHAVDRAIGDGGKRAGVGPKGMLDSLKNPLKITETKTDEMGRASQRFIGKDATTAVNPETGKIVSVNPTSTKTAEKLIKAAEQ